jgi:hypothetical protein
VRKLHFICIGWLLCGLLAGIARAETFQLNDGRTITGEMVLPGTSEGVNFKIESDQFQRVPWTNFSQETLKEFAKNPKLAPLVEPFIEVSQEEKAQKTEVEIKDVRRLARPEARSLLGALSSSSVGLTVLLLLYAANIFAAYEVSVFRAQRAALVCGVSAVAPLIGPILFLSLPSRRRVDEEAVPEPAAAGQVQKFAVPPEPAPAAAEHEASGLRLAHMETGQPGSNLPKTQVFQRGAFTFNRRFFETKFPGFFGIVRRDAEKDMVLQIKSSRGLFTVERISRITANDLHAQVRKGEATEEIMIPFVEVQEIQLKHKNA